jgi:hypothetical protein
MTTYIVHCAHCSVRFEANERRAKFCSRTCSGMARRTKITKQCQHCGIDFLVPPGKVGKYCSKHCYDEDSRAGARKGQGRKNPAKVCAHCNSEFFCSSRRQRNGAEQETYYCSRDCYMAVHTVKHTLPCVACGKDMVVHKGGKTGKKYCSMECKIAHKRPQPVNCKCCGVLFQGIAFRLNVNGEIRPVYKERKTCSDKCHIQWISDNEERKRKIGIAFSGEKHPHWKGGASITNSRTGRCTSKSWKTIAENARKRDGYQCMLCGVLQSEHGRKLDVHHIVPYHNFAKATEANRLSNLVTLCKTCHMVEEHKIVERQTVLQIWQHG